jgi:hypothetical protein
MTVQEKVLLVLASKPILHKKILQEIHDKEGKKALQESTKKK